nr:hypothetical protein [Nanoarchaeum sp.]
MFYFFGTGSLKANWDLLLLLAGENEETFPRSNHALGLFNHNNIGNILVSGSVGGLSQEKPNPYDGPHIRIANYLNLNGIPADKIFTDYRPVDTFGNFVFSYHQPLNNNPNPGELSTLILTETGHSKRTMQCASRVIPEDCNHRFNFSDGDYKPQLTTVNGLATYLWHRGLMRSTEYIKSNSQRAYDFLRVEHPFYQPGWFEAPVEVRRKEVLRKTLEWNGLSCLSGPLEKLL